MNWLKLETLIGENVPNCLKTFLSECAYDTFLSIQNISNASLSEIERHMNACVKVVQNLDCCHADTYKNQSNFKLLPGHRDFLLSISKYKFQEIDSDKKSPLPVILQAMIDTSQQNSGRNKRNYNYSDLVRFFSTYTYLSAGRSYYEFLRSNLDLPAISTVCE